MRISFEPFAAQILRGVPGARRERLAQRAELPVRVAVQRQVADGRRQVFENPFGSGTGHSFVFSRAATSICGESYGPTSRRPGRGSGRSRPLPPRLHRLRVADEALRGRDRGRRGRAPRRAARHLTTDRTVT